MNRTYFAFALLVSAISLRCFAEDLINDPNFKTNCAMCHGENAEGRERMKTPPMKEQAGKSEEELTKAIENGNNTTTPKMPPFKDKLTPEQIKALVAEIKALK